jgi:hypothetical protein
LNTDTLTLQKGAKRKRLILESQILILGNFERFLRTSGSDSSQEM